MKEKLSSDTKNFNLFINLSIVYQNPKLTDTTSVNKQAKSFEDKDVVRKEKM